MGIHFKEQLSRRVHLEHTLQRHLDAAEALLVELDELDSDPDLEPFLGSVATGPCRGDQRHWAQGATDGREEACEDEGADTGDDEPWLGSVPQGYRDVLDGEVLYSPELTLAEGR